MENKQIKPRVISISCAKGGVGKSTTTVALAEFLADEGNTVLVIDADYQASTSLSLIGDDAHNKIISKKDNNGNIIPGKTIYALLYDAVHIGEPGGKRNFDPKTHIIQRVSNLNSKLRGRIDLLASELEVMRIKRDLHLAGKRGGAVSRDTIFEWGLKQTLKNYDYVLIDTHPDVDTMAINALHISDYYINPVIPDSQSSRGVILMREAVREQEILSNKKIKCLGILYSMVRPINNHDKYKNVAKGTLKDMYHFETEIPMRAKAAEAMDYSMNHGSLGKKYGYQDYDLKDTYEKLIEEVKLRCQEEER
jgi:chromosome partitioning protein